MLIVLSHSEGVVHFNPAITFGFFFAGRLRFKYVLQYLVAQIIGGVIASGFAYLIHKRALTEELRTAAAGNSLNSTYTYETPTFDDVVSRYSLDVPENSDWLAVLLSEIIMSTQMCLISTIAVYNQESFMDSTAALAIGVSVMLGIASGATNGGGCLNPIRSNMPRFFSKIYDNWCYNVGPIVGSWIAGLCYHKWYDEDRSTHLLRRANDQVWHEGEVEHLYLRGGAVFVE